MAMSANQTTKNAITSKKVLTMTSTEPTSAFHNANWHRRQIFQPPLKQPAADVELPTDEKVDSSLLTSTEPHEGHSV